MVDVVQEVEWVYTEGPSIGSYHQGPSKRPERKTVLPASLQSPPGSPGRRMSIQLQQPPGNGCWQRSTLCGKRLMILVGRWLGEDWVLLALLGSSTALVGFLLDYLITQIQTLRMQWSRHGTDEIEGGTSFIIWMVFSVGLACVSVGCTHHISPQGIGSGIPEMKVILKGVNLSEYLSFRTLVSKVVGLLFALGSGLPIGKEGPFVHISSIITERFINNFPIFESIKNNQARRVEMLAAACAVGVASDFGAPIGGLLFSIEVTSTYFAVRNYWRGFFASVVAAFIFRMLAIATTDSTTITLLFTTYFDTNPFEVWELPVFLLLGATCGVLGACFVYICRRVVELRRSWSERVKFFSNRYVYTIIISSLIAILSFPGFIGKYMGMPQNKEINHLFMEKPLTTLDEWRSGGLESGVVFNLVVFVCAKFLVIPLAASLPIPAGVFVPVFVLGAGLGRLFGEVMLLIVPGGNETAYDLPCTSSFGLNSDSNVIVPGVYAVVGAAALAGSVTQTISTSVIVFELTGQLHHILPVMMSVLVANMICQKYSPSIYDSIILMKGLPYLPDLRKGETYNMTARDLMKTELEFVSLQCSYETIRQLLQDSDLTVFPLVDSSDTMFLVGAVQRASLEVLLEVYVDLAAMDDIQSDSEDTNLMPYGASSESSDETIATPNETTHSHTWAKKKKTRIAKKFRGTGLDDGLLSNIDINNADDDMVSDPQPTPIDTLPHDDDSMNRMIDLSGVPIDPSPFQIVEKTSLYKVHTLFSLLGVNVAYVTSRGRLVGTIASSEIRKGIEQAGGRRLEAREAERAHPRHRIRFTASTTPGASPARTL